MAPIHRVAVIQWHIKALAVEENHSKACAYIRSAAAEGAKLAVLPEYHLNGWVPEDPLYAAQASDTAKYLANYQSLARELKICLVPGTIVEKHTVNEGDKPKEVFYNTAYFISPTGDILGSYRKKNLWLPERSFLTSSARERHQVFDTPIGRVGMLICWDLVFPEAFRELASKGVEIVILPSFWTELDSTPKARTYNPKTEALLLDSTLTARCFEGICGIVFTNAAGPGEEWMGMSRVSMPLVGTVRSMGNEEGFIVVDVDMDLLGVAEESYGIRKDLAKEGWHYSRPS